MKPYRFLCILILCSALPLTFAVAQPADINTHKSALKLVLNKIQSLKQALFSEESQYKQLQRKLKTSEIAIGNVAKNLHNTQLELTSQKNLLEKVEREKIRYQIKLEKQKSILMAQIKSAYMLGRQPYLKLLLNQEDPQKFDRALHYYQYLTQARLQSIQSIKQLSMKIAQTAQVIQERTHTLKNTYDQQKIQKTTLNQEEKEHEKLLQQTHQQIQDKSSQLTQLYENKKQLEQLIKTLSQAQLTGYVPGATFHQMHKKLIWPVKGAILQSFGQSLSEGRLHSTGILIGAPLGKPIRAVFPGKVVFSNWLRGFGLLTIIKHGPNYLTLYGRNQSLYVKTGETVKAGQTIATVGNSGGFQQNALYFEIRYKGQPTDPGQWLRRHR